MGECERIMTPRLTLATAALKMVEQARETLVPLVIEDDEPMQNIMWGLTAAADNLEAWIDRTKSG